MGKKAAAAPASNRDDRHSSESGADNDDHDHDHDHDDHDHDNDHDHDHDHNGGDEATPVKRKRLTQACDPCRKKKIKCDGIKPSCANCLKLNGNCTYLPSMKKRGPRQGYIELLEKRLDKMEQLLQHGPAAVDPELLDSKSILSSHLRPGARRTTSPPADEVEGEPKKRPDPEARYFGTTSGYTTQHSEYDKQNDPGNGVVGPKYSSQSTFPKERPKKSLYGIKDEVPRKEILDHLIELFFDSIYFQLPIIHPGTFMKQYKEGKVSPNLLNAMCASVARFSNHPDVVTTPAFLAGEPFATNIRAVLVDSIDVPTVSNVQALLLLSMYEYGAARGPRAWMFGGMAVRQAQELGLNREDSSPVFYLKGDWVMRETRRRTFWACFILDVLASSSSGRPRMMDERDCEVLLPSEDHDWYEERPVVTEMLEEDHDSSSGTEHEPPSNPAEESWEGKAASRHSVPPKDPSEEAKSDTKPQESDSSETKADDSNTKAKKQGNSHILSSFAYLIRIVAVLGKVSQYVNRPRSKKSIPPSERGSEFSLIDTALTAWHNSIPPHLAYSLENAKMVKDKGEGCIIVFMHVIYHTSVVLLHRPILAADKSSLPLESKFVENSAARCSDAASKVSDVLEFVQYYNCPPRIFISAFFAYPVFTTATIHITNAFASDAAVASRARRSLSIHVKILQTMKSYWSMADKFFYIIRDLYSIQSKISSSAASAAVPQVTAGKAQAASSTSTSANAGGPQEAAGTGSEAGTVTKDAGGPDGTVGNTKLASISSFLKSDSGLIALWRRATEMQVLDEAKQEQRRLSMSEETIKRPVTLEKMKEIDPQDKALQEHQPPPRPPSTEGSKNARESESVRNESTTSAEKRHQDEDSINPKATKQTKTSKSTKSSSRAAQVQRPTEDDTAVTTRQSPKEIISLPLTSNTGGGDQQSVQSPTTYRHSVLQQPQALQQHDSYILQPMQIQRTNGPAPGATVAVPEGDVNRHLLGLYAQQHQQQEALNKSLDMLQNANIQRQQQQLQMQQQQAAQMSSLAFGPPGGYPGSFLSTPLMSSQQNFSQQAPSAPIFGLPLVYGSNFEQSQAQRMQTESLGSLFDFALPQEDISFLSNSFQVTPMMMQETMGLTNTSGPGGAAGGGGVPIPGPNNGGRMAPDAGPTSAAAGASHLSPAISTTSSTTPLGRTLDAQSPPTDSGSLFNISPGLHSFLMADEAFTSVDSTPNNLIRYLQLHHQQELQQQELQQQQDMQPLLNQQNSLIFDDYHPWSQFSALQQQQQQGQQVPQQQQQSPLDRLGHSRNLSS
ncbi:hypothetical protein BGW39_006981 [Mortierella sp. 14UC]|nr:hypothetical protein BGW39_006981 [Mortierella sp. 14UC]